MISQRQALEACERNEHGPVRQLRERTGEPSKVCLRKIEGLVRKGYADYGVSPVYAWLTPEGVARLAELRDKA